MNVLGATVRVKSFFKLNQDESQSKPAGSKSLCNGSVIQLKDKSPEDKRERKKLLKDYRVERRIERKANTPAFKKEKKQQEKSQQNIC
ncbi:hypothetical protein pipiens_017989, partial [Culex pipiens pipiens]